MRSMVEGAAAYPMQYPASAVPRIISPLLHKSHLPDPLTS